MNSGLNNPLCQLRFKHQQDPENSKTYRGNSGSSVEKILSPTGKQVLKENVPVIAMIGVYILAVYVVHAVYGIHDRVVLTVYSDWLIRLALIFAAIFIGIHLYRKTYKRYFTLQYLVGFFIVLILASLFKGAFASFKQTIPLVHGFSWDTRLMQLDYVLHFGRHPWRFLESLLSHSVLVNILDLLYVGWFLFLVLFCLWMAWTHRRRLRLHFFMATILVWGLLGSFLGTILSSAGPCYYSKVVTVAPNPYSDLMQKLTEIHQSSFLWALFNQSGLWEAKEQGVWMPFGGISAMPSIHLGMAVIFAFVAFNFNRWLGVLFIGYVITIQIGSVILGWHYAVDGYIGIILSVLIWKAVGLIVNRYMNIQSLS